MALNNAGPDVQGCYLVTTLEPCVKVKKVQIFDSCCDLIIQRGIDSVVIGSQDSSPCINSGIGRKYLQRRNVDVRIFRDLGDVIIEELMPKSRLMNSRWQ